MLGIAALLCFCCASAIGAVLGELKTDSFLGERLDVRIALLNIEAQQLSEVTLGNDDDYAALGLTRNAVSRDLRISQPARDEDGWFLRVTSGSRVSDLVVDLVLVMPVPGARQTRHYSALLDLAPLVETPLAELPPQNVIIPSPVESPANVAAASAGGFRPDSSTYQVRGGDSLYRIALRLAPEGVEPDWFADALFQLNPEAFVHGNRNRLLAGAELTLPSLVTDSSIVTAQRRRAPLQVPRSDEPRDEVRVRAPPATDEIVDSLGRWVGRSNNDMIDNIEEVRRDLNYARTEVETYRQQNRSLRDRIGALEERLGNIQRLMELREEIARAEYERQLGVATATVSSGLSDTPSLAADEPIQTTLPGAVSAASTNAVGRTVEPAADAVAEIAALGPGAPVQHTTRRSGFGNWFPYLGGLMVAILAGFLFYLRARSEKQRGRDFYRALENTATRSYLPGQV